MTTKHQAGIRVSEYVLEAPLGAGAFGEVWRARHHVWNDQFVAVKLPIESEYVRYLQREGVVVHGIRHQNVVRVLGLDPFAENPYLIMELVRGPSLGQVIKENAKGVPIATARRILRGILAAMEAAHAANVLHRDLKPGNVLLDLNSKSLADMSVEDVKVTDFGLGVDSGDTLRSIAQSVSMDRDSNQLVGTLAYMAPEVREAQRPHDARSDLYSIGVILFELLTGERPAGAEYPSTVRSEVPVELDNVFRKLYSRHDRRYESATAVLADLGSDGAKVADRDTASVGTDRYRVVLQSAGDKFLQVINVVRQGTGLGLKEVKDLVDNAPSMIVDNVDAGAANRWVQQIEDVGGRVWLYSGERRVPISRVSPPLTQSAGRCPACSAAVVADDQFCTACGKQLTPRVRRCPSCQGFPGPHDRFCIFCGGSLGLAVE